ncbi:MAG: VacB/RNase II family 3'-5' exoribonuclease [bacterium]|nr:VacB/RNase II family 3'-5' exoribonuclease [bacterium]
MNIEEVITNLITKYNKGIKLEKIIECCNKKEKDEVLRIIKTLELNGKIYITDNEKCILFPDEYKIGELYCNHKGNRFVLYNKMPFYVSQEEFNSALDFDIVVFEPNFQTRQASIKKILERKNNKIVCEVTSKGNKKILSSINTPGKITVIINENELNNFVCGDRLVVEIEKTSFLDCTKGKIIKKIGHKDDLDIDEITIANSKGFNTDFNEEYLKELDSLPKKVTYKDFKNRLDLTQKEIFTIDGIYTKDIDDAVSLEILKNGNYLLGVHIADVSHYIKPGSIIFNEAYERGTSVYLGSSVNPMFHHLISNGICSLNPDENRLAKTVFMEINSKGDIVNYKIERSVICSKKKMNYTDVNKIINDGIIPEGYEKYTPTLLKMSELSNIITNKRLNNGYVEFASNEIKTVTDNHNNAIGFMKESHGPSEKIIENFMIYANETITTHYAYFDVPFIYRIHGIPDFDKVVQTAELVSQLGYKIGNLKDIDSPKVLQEILKEFREKEEFPIISSLFLRSMDRAKYSTNNIGHFALGSDYYTHFTSPIRRLSDLIIHTLIDIYDYEDLNIINYDTLEERLNKAANHASYKELQEEKAEEELNKLRMAQYMSNFIGETFIGRIYEIYPDEMMIGLDQNVYGIVPLEFIEKNNLKFYSYNRSLIGNTSGYLLGNKVEVKVISVSIPNKKIYFSIEKNLSINGKPKIKSLSKQKKPI